MEKSKKEIKREDKEPDGGNSGVKANNDGNKIKSCHSYFLLLDICACVSGLIGDGCLPSIFFNAFFSGALCLFSHTRLIHITSPLLAPKKKFSFHLCLDRPLVYLPFRILVRTLWCVCEVTFMYTTYAASAEKQRKKKKRSYAELLFCLAYISCPLGLQAVI